MVNRRVYLDSWVEWFKSSTDDWDLFTVTVTFKSSSNKGYTKDRCLSTYNTVFLNKIRKQLCRNPNKNSNVIGFENFSFHEYDEKSLFKSMYGSTPNHIHSILPINKRFTHRFWSVESNSVVDRLRKDIKSIKFISSYLIEPVRFYEIGNWVKYCMKDKKISEI